jgi:CrcB protein
LALLSVQVFRLPAPGGTFIINMLGTFVLGWIMSLSSRGLVADSTRLILAVGFAGAFTTFSTFILETDALLKAGHSLFALLNVGGSLICGIAALWLGIWIGAR